MTWALATIALCGAACAPLSPLRSDAGAAGGQAGGGSAGGVVAGGAAGGGTAGGSTAGGGSAEPPWVEVSLQVPAGTTGAVQRLGAGAGAVYALVSNQYVLRSLGGRFDEVLVFSKADINDFQYSASGRGVVTVGRAMLSCAGSCDQPRAFEDVLLPSAPLALCSSPSELALLTRAADGGVSVYAQAGNDWPMTLSAPVRAPLACTRTARGVVIGAQGGVMTTFDAGARLEVPDVTALGRGSANEAWTHVVTDGALVFAASARGAVGRRAEDGAWSVASALDGAVTAMALGSATDVWVAGTGVGLARFDGAVWLGAGRGPPQLSTFEALAVDGAHVYVGGADASRVARVFRRPR
ncbi:MAG: hypothetical protein INH41_22540 [Myxococcaceae bacterium]|nr:hypothetical protein [Myxococcaceae bacterium]MCA3015176.1 hypothetical protein [Myxococcaceae bacterium]